MAFFLNLEYNPDKYMETYKVFKMLKTLAVGLNLETEAEPGKGETGKDNKTRRLHRRRDADRCVTAIRGKDYPIMNWSPGGLLVFGDGRPFALNDEVDITLKFRIRDSVVNVPHKAKIIRKAYDKVALKFFPLSQQVKKLFQSVIDDHIAAAFAESQLSYAQSSRDGGYLDGF